MYQKNIMMKIHYKKIIEDLKLIERLKAYQVTVIGTPPLGIEIWQSDIDLICNYQLEQLNQLFDVLKKFKALENWKIEQSKFEKETWICSFGYLNWVIEIFCSTTPIYQQAGFRHFKIEHRLLNLAHIQFKKDIIALKNKGFKTEPAFAELLSLTGDPYARLNELYEVDDSELILLLQKHKYAD